MLVIDPEECIDCGACVPACPVEAIFPEDEVPEHWIDFTQINASLAQKWPMIDEQKEPLKTAEDFRNVDEKRGLLSETPALFE